MLASAPVTLVGFASVVLDNDGPARPLQIIGSILSAALLFVALGGFGAELGSDAVERRQAVAVRSAA
jgi:hypothetical protein